MLSFEIISILLGTTIGLILATMGAGATTLAIPLLISFLPLTVFQAAPIALLAVFMASSSGAIQGLLKGTVRYKTAILMTIVGVMFAPIGVKLAQHASNLLLSALLCCILLFISIRSWQSALNHSVDNSHLPSSACMINPATSKVFWTASCTKRLAITGAVAGFLSGLLGVGGGFVIVPSLNKVSNFNQPTIIATTLTAISLITVSSIVSHIQTSAVNWQIAIPFAISTTLSMLLITALFSHKIPKKISQKGFAILCLVAAAHLAIKSFT